VEKGLLNPESAVALDLAADRRGRTAKTHERTDWRTAIPREISSRSASVKAYRERFLSAGPIPSVGLK